MSAAGALAGRSYMRGLPPWKAKSLQEKLAAAKIPFARVNIGLPHKKSRNDRLQLSMASMIQRRDDKELEKLARNHKLYVDMDKVHEDWLATDGPEHIKRIADHYSIFKHLYDEGFFLPTISLNIFYQIDDESGYPVYFGNVIKPTEASRCPDVSYEAEEGTYWTLMLTNLDGNLEDSDKEYLHWCVTNIPGNRLEQGETVVEYFQPLPPKGTGFHRYVFVLYKQNGKDDLGFQKVRKTSPLSERSFHTRDWYSKNQDKVTPAGLAFFQSDWDPNITKVFHDMDMKEPIFEYDFPKPYIRPQAWFPLRRAFDTYMDRYRDPKQIAKEFLMRKLKTENPFKKPDPPLKYPNAHPFPRSMPSWLKTREKMNRLKEGRITEY